MLLLVILSILAIPFLILLGFFHLIQIGFENLGIAPEAVVGILLFMLVGSLVNIPLGKRRIMEVEEVRFFGLMRKTKFIAQGLSINVGGAVIPVLISLYLLTKIPLESLVVPVVLMVVVANRLARFVPQRGIAVPALLVALISALIAFVAVQENPAPVAFIAGTLGVLLGADLLHLPHVMREGKGVMSIGGAGVFDGIFLIGIISALLAGL